MDADTAAGLLDLAGDAQVRRRRQDPEAERMLEARYREVREALDWYDAAATLGAHLPAGMLQQFRTRGAAMSAEAALVYALSQVDN